MRRYSLGVVNVVALVLTLALAACSGGSSPPCSATTCANGCCNATGQCVPAQSASACGLNGTTCASCGNGEDCVNGACKNPIRCQATPPLCQDDSIMQLSLKATVNSDPLAEEGTAPNFLSVIDARAGGLNPTNSYVYMSFTSTGLVRKDLSDEQALASLDWDIAMRRFILRINSGVSGPSCVEAARTAPTTTFDSLSQAPSGLMWRTEKYFTPPADGGSGCTLVSHPSGLMNAPDTALGSYWTYQTCVEMSGNTYVIHTRDDKYVKLQVLGYYSPLSAQDTCNTTKQPSGTSALVRIKWAYISAPP